jgi:predicted nucleic acid-binding protein
VTSAVDTNILLDLLGPDAAASAEADRLLTAALRAGGLVISEPVYAEMAAWFRDRGDLDGALAGMGLRLQASGTEVLHRAGAAWREYRQHRPAHLQCPRCGHAETASCGECGVSLAGHQHVLADFIIGAHAVAYAGRLLTRDRGYYRTYFPELIVLP